MGLLKRIAIITLKIFGGFVLVIALVITSGVVYSLWESRNTRIEYEQFSVLESKDGNHSLIVEIRYPRLPYGSHSVAVKVINASGSEVIATKDIKLANDGMRVDSENISTQWINKDTAAVCMRGEEQKDNYLIIDIQSLTISEKEENC
jgi:archaellum component FlaF (FlaF/FlaG flagellin family)